MNIYFQLLNQHLIKSNRNIHTGKLDGTLKTIFGKYLLVTNTVSCGLLMATGDTIQQNIEKYRAHKSKPFDWKRTGRMFIIGLVEGPPQHLFYKLLDRNIPNRDFKSILKKIILDQLIASPTCISIFLFGMGLLEGQTWETTVTESKAKFIKIYQVM
ncbi:hypothetical protein C0J52_04865 [Blattella germanica]|nr:hypothetical protein C0J52_04865 [Blattella germanica]